MTTIGIDPGKSGGIATINGSKVFVSPMPETARDVYDLLESLVREYPESERGDSCTAYIELVHSSPQMGVKSAFTFGNGYGQLEMALTALHVPMTRVRPQLWQKTLGCMTKGDKNVSKRRAQELFPQINITHKTADALLIAEYGRRQI